MGKPFPSADSYISEGSTCTDSESESSCTSSGGLESEDPLECADIPLAEIQAELDRTRALCEAKIEKHLDEWLLSNDGLPTYEDWLAELHPENVRERTALGPTIDARMYLEGCFQRQLWNSRIAGCPSLTKCEQECCHVLPRVAQESAPERQTFPSLPFRAMKGFNIEGLRWKGSPTNVPHLNISELTAFSLGKLKQAQNCLDLGKLQVHSPAVGSKIAAAFQWLGEKSEAENVKEAPCPCICCYHCNVKQEFTPGADFVCCFDCRTMNQVVSGSQVGIPAASNLCTACGYQNAACSDALSVRCFRCRTVMDLTPGSSRPSTLADSGEGAQEVVTM